MLEFNPDRVTNRLDICLKKKIIGHIIPATIRPTPYHCLPFCPSCWPRLPTARRNLPCSRHHQPPSCSSSPSLSAPNRCSAQARKGTERSTRVARLGRIVAGMTWPMVFFWHRSNSSVTYGLSSTICSWQASHPWTYISHDFLVNSALANSSVVASILGQLFLIRYQLLLHLMFCKLSLLERNLAFLAFALSFRVASISFAADSLAMSS